MATLADGGSDAASSSLRDGASQLPHHWAGTVNVTMHGPKIGGDGSLVSVWNLEVRWRELSRIEVKDERGRLTGEFVLLQDDGTSWTGHRTGHLESVSDCLVWTTDYAGQGHGDRSIDTGWAYFSLVDDDPLADWFSDGSYYVYSGQTGQAITGTTTSTYQDTCSGSSNVQQREDSLLPLSFSLGREFFSPLPGIEEISAEELAVTAEQVSQFQATGVRFVDSSRRTLEGELMEGSYTSTGQADQGLYWEVDWRVERRLSIEPTVEPVDHDWLPQGLDDPNRVVAKASIDPAYGVEGKFRFRLVEVTREPGDAMNHGDKNDLEPDLMFVTGQANWEDPIETADGWQIASTELSRTAEVEIEARDYGAWAKLECDVEIDSVHYDCRSESGELFVTVPDDQELDRIADSWQEDQDAAGQPAEWDGDEQPAGQASSGDGLSLYEEYRGFYEESGRHLRLDPNLKQLFVRDEDGLATDANLAGISNFQIVYIDDDGWTGPDPLYTWGSIDADKRRVNFNSSGYSQITQQHALHIELAQLAVQQPGVQTKELIDAQYLFGVSFGSGIRSPATASRTVVYQDEIERAAQAAINYKWAYVEEQRALLSGSGSNIWETDCPNYSPPPDDLFSSIVEHNIRTTTLHEVGHGVGVNHHAPTHGGDVQCVMRYFDSAEKLESCNCDRYCSGEPEPVAWPSRYGDLCWNSLQVSDTN